MRRTGIDPFVISFSKKMIPTEEDLADLTAVEDVLMVGYPLGLWDQRNNLPIFRRGITATHSAVDYEGEPVFTISLMDNAIVGIGASETIKSKDNARIDAEEADGTNRRIYPP
jgi:hypothetical protein